MRRQHSRRRATQRLLLLAAATTAGIGISLAVESAAHAADRDLPPPSDTAAAVSNGARGTSLKAVTPKPRAKHPATAARDLAEGTAKQVDGAARPGRNVPDVVAQAVPLPVLGGADGAPPVVTPPSLLDPTIPPVDVNIPSAGTLGRAASQTAPGPAREQPPLSPSAGPGAPVLPHPVVGTCPAQSMTSVAARHQVVAPARPGGLPTGDQLGGGNRDHTTAAPTVDTHHATPGDRWTHPLLWQQATISYIADRDGRTHPPSPPPG